MTPDRRLFVTERLADFSSDGPRARQKRRRIFGQSPKRTGAECAEGLCLISLPLRLSSLSSLPVWSLEFRNRRQPPQSLALLPVRRQGR